MFPSGWSHAEIELTVIAVADAGNGLVRNFGAIRAVEQTSDLVAHAIDADAFPCAVTAELRQLGQGFPDGTAPPQLSAFIP